MTRDDYWEQVAIKVGDMADVLRHNTPDMPEEWVSMAVDLAVAEAEKIAALVDP